MLDAGVSVSAVGAPHQDASATLALRRLLGPESWFRIKFGSGVLFFLPVLGYESGYFGCGI